MRKTELETARRTVDEFVDRTQESRSESTLVGSTERLERAFETEHTRATSLNIRATALAGVSAISILLLAQFSATWLDDNTWKLSDIWDTALQVLLPTAEGALAIAALSALIALWPRTRSSQARRERIDSLVAGDEAAQASLLLGMTDHLRATNETRGRWIRRASVFFAVALVLIIAQSMIFAFRGEPADAARGDTPGVPDANVEGLPSEDEQLALALRYAPRVWLHPVERTGPMDATVFIENSKLGWRLHRRTETVVDRGNVVAERLGYGCVALPTRCYEHNGYLSFELTRPYMRHATRPPRLALRRGFTLDVRNDARQGQARQNPTAPVYFEFRPTSDELLLTFWFFYGYSSPHVIGAGPARRVLSHEGDWENVDVALSPDSREPLALYLYGHGAPTRLDWQHVCALEAQTEQCGLGADGRPVVYSALESHASYADEGGTKLCRGVGQCACDRRQRGWRWDTWATRSGVRPARDEPWYGFGGAWGSALTLGDTTGPLGPRIGKLPADPESGPHAATRC